MPAWASISLAIRLSSSSADVAGLGERGGVSGASFFRPQRHIPASCSNQASGSSPVLQPRPHSGGDEKEEQARVAFVQTSRCRSQSSPKNFDSKRDPRQFGEDNHVNSAANLRKQRRETAKFCLPGQKHRLPSWRGKRCAVQWESAYPSQYLHLYIVQQGASFPLVEWWWWGRATALSRLK